MNHAYTRPGGIWNPGTDLLAAELADIDWKSTHSLSDLGGTYSFDEDMVIGGDPFVAWVFDLEVSFNGGTVFGADALFGEDVTFLSNVTMQNGDVSIGTSGADLFSVFAYSEFQDLTVNGEFTANGAVFFNDPATFYEDVGFENGVAVAASGFLNADGNCFLGSPGFVELLGATTVRAPIGFADAGKMKWRSQTIAAAGNQSIVAAQVDTVLIPDGVMASGNSLTISDTGAADGMRVRFKTEDNSNVVYVRNPGGSALNGGLVGGVNTTTWIDVERIGGAWKLTGAGRDSYT